MIALDTNVMVRYLTQDDKKQSALANALIDGELTEQKPGFITLITLVEICWVLESCYGQKKESLISILSTLLATRQLRIERADLAWRTLKLFEKCQADFSDALIAIVAEENECEKIVTFDRKATSAGMTLLG